MASRARSTPARASAATRTPRDAEAPLCLGSVGRVQAQPTDTELVQRRRKQIVAAAADLFSRKGFEATTVGEIAAAAGISTGLVYHYARSKEDVLFLTLLTVLDSYRRELPAAMAAFKHPVQRLVSAVRAYASIIDRRMDATVLAYRATKNLPREHRQEIKNAEMDTNALMESCIREGIRCGQFREVDPVIAAYQFVSFAHNWALKQWRFKDHLDLQAYLASGLDVLMRGVATPAGWRMYRAMPGLQPALTTGRPA
ncbi:MAG: TetR/AcrR family transcriptional regulator [Betaproteobacteria bacterium]